MSRRSRRHGRNIKKATSAQTKTTKTCNKVTATAALKKSNKLQKKKPAAAAARGRGRWKRTGRGLKARVKTDVQKERMELHDKTDETETLLSVKEEKKELETQVIHSDIDDQEEDTNNELKIDIDSKDSDVKSPLPEQSPAESDHDADSVPPVVDEKELDVCIAIADDVPIVAEAPIENSEVDLLSPCSSYDCPTCGKDFDSAMALTLHLKQHSTTGNQIHKCIVCNKILSSASSLDRHMLVHSGERPFKCKMCDMAFTTNGNMHRHMRTHGELNDASEVGKGVDLRKREAVKRKLSLETASLQDLLPNNEQEKLLCPVCGKSLLCKYGLQSHMETHPNDPILCQSCGEISANYSIHINHKCSALDKKVDSCKSACCGFQELNFMDFSTNKFSLVSKSFCEQNIKRPSSAFHVFECSECKKAFPCGRALKLHMNSHRSKSGTFCATCDCNFAGPAFLQLHQLKHRSTENCVWKNDSTNAKVAKISHAGKEDFLALFNLQTKESQSSLLEGLKECRVKEGKFESMDYFVHGKIKNKMTVSSLKTENPNIDSNNNGGGGSNDFADIQSIITVTSTAPLIKDVHTSPIAVRSVSPITVMPAQQPESPQEADLANSSPETPSINSAVQPVTTDSVPEIVPVIVANLYSCKICNQKFRTINSLKRHCKMHVQRGSNYSCHLCSYVSVDKSTLIRHLRTHNGERPFQCTICKYAFTTKANCERHVRKRHKKLTKPEIRNCMQYNPNMALKTPDLPTSEISNSETVCKYCNVDFKFNRVLRHHLRSLHNSCNRKPFNCKICNFGFSTKNNCIRHVLKQHPNMKDKLRSVVIPNAQKIPHPVSEPESDIAEVNTASSPSESLQDATEQTEPLNLDCHVEEQPLNLSTEQTTLNNITVSSETVIAAESLVCLSETLIPQDEPLDLAIRPLDLSFKSQPLVAENSPSTASSYSPLRRDCIPQSNTSNMSIPKPPNTHESHANIVSDNRSTIDLSNAELCSSSSKSLYTRAPEASRAFGQKFRAFTCIYCSSGFTLKSNMERHIKRKHPEFARPTRSRNFIPAVIAHRSQRNNITMLSDKTRDALRHVLNTKVQHNVLSTKVYGRQQPLLANVYGGQKRSAYVNTFAIKLNPIDKDTGSLNIATDLSARQSSEIAESVNLRTDSPSLGGDENSTDLASVSSVICMANSQQFKQYFDKHPSDKCSTDQSTEVVQPNENTSASSSAENNVACPFCSRKFPWSSSLRRHILTHTGQKPYKCPRCALWFTTKSNCERHLIRKHGHKGELIYRSVPDRPYKCNQCPSSTFSTQGNLRKHFYLKHWTKSYMGMNTKVISKKNPKEESSSKDVPKVNASQSTEEHSYSQVERKKLDCHFCSQRFSDVSCLSKHMQKHDHVIYMCYLCRKTFPTSDGCYAHFKTSHSLVYQQMSLNETSPPIIIADCQGKDESTEKKDKSAAMACMICFQRIAGLDELQQHVKRHMPTSKGNISMPENLSQHNSAKGEGEVSDKKTTRPKKKIQNSLLYLFTPTTTELPSTSKPLEGKNDNSIQEEGSDLIQNLLGIHDSRIIDEMLVSADSAARLLGVKEV